MCFGKAIPGITDAIGAVVEYNAEVEDFNNQEAQWQENYANSLEAGREEQKTLLAKGFQDQQVTSQRIGEITREEAEATAIAEVSAGASGVGGNLVDGLIRGISGDAANGRYVAKANAASTAFQLTRELTATNIRTKQRINSVTRPTAPDPSGAVLKLIGGVAKAGNEVDFGKPK